MIYAALIATTVVSTLGCLWLALMWADQRTDNYWLKRMLDEERKAK